MKRRRYREIPRRRPASPACARPGRGKRRPAARSSGTVARGTGVRILLAAPTSLFPQRKGGSVGARNSFFRGDAPRVYGRWDAAVAFTRPLHARPWPGFRGDRPAGGAFVVGAVRARSPEVSYLGCQQQRRESSWLTPRGHVRQGGVNRGGV